MCQSSGAVWKSRWPSWAPRPYSLCGRKATLNSWDVYCNSESDIFVISQIFLASVSVVYPTVTWFRFTVADCCLTLRSSFCLWFCNVYWYIGPEEFWMWDSSCGDRILLTERWKHVHTQTHTHTHTTYKHRHSILSNAATSQEFN